MATRSCPGCHAEVPVREPALRFCPACGAELSSVRPPDLGGADLPADPVDPLAGWDLDPVDPTGDALPDLVVLAAGAIFGAAVGSALAGRGRRRGGGAIGTAVGLVAAAAARRVWELPPPDDTWARSFQG